MMRHSLRLSLAAVMLSALLFPLVLGAAPQRAPIAATALRPSSADLRLKLDQALRKSPLSAKNRQKFSAGFATLPPEAQQAAAALLDPALADRVGLPGTALRPAKAHELLQRLDRGIIEILNRPWLSELHPEGGATPGALAFAFGGNYNTDCVVLLNGALAPETHFWNDGVLVFRIPAAAALGTVYSVSVRDQVKDKASIALPFRAVAERGWRGVHGLSFPNFTDPSIPWNVYRACFGPGNVEFADGTHRPSAQTWYDGSYRSVGAYGNCYGMAQLSLRTRRFTHAGHDPATLNNVMHGDWVCSTVTWGAWTLPWGTTAKEAVESLQGQQLVEPMATRIADFRASQDNKSAWTWAKYWLDAPHYQPTHNTLFGHSVVVFGTELAGTSHKFCFYDNNNPYAETDGDAPDPDHGVTNWDTGGFTYHGYTRTRTYDSAALLGQPLLPAGVGPADGADSAAHPRAVRFEVPRVATLVMTDERGRTGLAANGIPGLLEIEPDGGLGPIPPTFPRIFLLTQPAGRTINFTVPNAGRQARQLTCFSRGGILQLSLNGASIRANFSQLDQANAQVTLPDPAGSGLQQLNLIAPISQAEERQLLADSFTGLRNTALGASFSPDRSAVELLTPRGTQPVQMRLQFRRHRPGGADLRPGLQRTIPVGQLLRIGPANWAVIGSQLQVQQIALPPNRLQLR